VIKYNIPRITFNDWLKNKNKFLSLNSNKLMKTTIHKGRKPLNIEVEDKIISFFEFNRKLYNPITIFNIYKIIRIMGRKKKCIKGIKLCIHL
jgi:hypothetical protein